MEIEASTKGASDAGDKNAQLNLIKELAAAVSTQAQVANRTWVALMTVAVVAVLPRISTASSNVSLPFSLGEVDQIWFHSVVFFILIVLATAFASAHAQQVRAQKLAHTVVDSLATTVTPEDQIHPRDLFDIMRMPSVIRLAPLAQSLRGKHQFFSASQTCPTWLRIVTVGYYGVLKMASLIVYFGLPAWALWRAHYDLSILGGLRLVLAFSAFVAGLALLQVLVADFLYSVKIMRYLWRIPEAGVKGSA